MTNEQATVSRRKFLVGTAAIGAMSLVPAAVRAQTAAPPNIVVTLANPAGQTLRVQASEGKPWPAPFNGQTRWEVTRQLGPEKIWISFGADAGGRVDVWFYLAFSTAANNVVVPLTTTISVNGQPQNLWGQGPKIVLRAVRSTLWRWQSAPRKWQFERIPDLVSRNVLLRHSSAPLSTNRYQAQASLGTALPPGVPFTDTNGKLGGTKVSDFLRGAATGGERDTIGLIHERHARVIEEVLRGNMAYAQQAEPSLRLIQELIGQYPGYFFFHVESGKILDPSDSGQLGKSCWHRNPRAAEPARYIPQAGTNNYKYGEGTASWDIAHPQNHHYLPYLLTDDPYYLLMAQMNGVAGIGYGTGRNRPANYRGVMIEEERGLWWGLRNLWWAEMLTPASGVPQPFLPRSYFSQGVDQTINYVTGTYNKQTYQDQMQRFWGFAAPLTAGKYMGYSGFMNDYGHEVLLWMFLSGRTVPPAFMMWKMQHLFNRITLWGEYLTGYTGIVPGIMTIVGPAQAAGMPYNTLDAYHQWVSAQRQGAGLAPLSRTNPKINYSGALHRDWHIVHGLLNLLKPARAKGLPMRFDPGERLNALMATTIDTRTNRPPAFPLGVQFFAKQGFAY